MKTIATTFTALAILGASHFQAAAGDREWATAGKILTGVVAGAAIARAFEPVPVYTTTTYYPAPVVYAPTPAPVFIQPAPAIVYAAPPAVVYSAPVVYSTPIVVRPAPVYVAPRPFVSFHVGFGHSHSHGHWNHGHRHHR
jgi:hypothetical protein